MAYGDFGSQFGFDVQPFTPRPRRRRAAQPALTPERESSIVRDLSTGTVGGLAAFGNLLDLPHSILRDTASGITNLAQGKSWGWENNPVDQIFSPFSDKNRKTGRDLLRQWNMAGDKDTWKNFAGGLGLEIFTDPLTYLSFGTSAVGKAGQALKMAGLMDDITLKAATKGIGPRGLRFKSTQDFLKMADDPAKAMEDFTKAATAKGWDANELMTQQVGGMAKFRLPFTEGKVFGGKTAEKMAGVLDPLSMGFRASAPMRAARRTFSSEAGGQLDFASQMQAKRDTRYAKMREGEYRSQLMDSYTELEPLFKSESRLDNEIFLIRAAEDPLYRESIMRGELPEGASQEIGQRLPQIQRFLQVHDKILSDTRLAEQSLGLRSPEIDDYIRQWEKIGYTPRVRHFIDRERGNAITKVRNEYDTNNPFTIMRRLGLRDTNTGTQALVKMSMDDTLKVTYGDFRSGKVTSQNIVGLAHTISRYEDLPKLYNQIGGILQQRYGRMLGELNVMDQPADLGISQSMLDLAKWITHLEPEHATNKIPAFSTDPFANVQRRVAHSIRSQLAAKNILNMAVHSGDRLGHIADRQESVGWMLGKTHLDKQGAAESIHRQILELVERGDQEMITKMQRVLNVQNVEKKLRRMSGDDLVKILHVPERQIEHASEYMKAFTSPKAVSQIGQFMDWYHSFLKPSLTTPFPAFHARNFVSGAMQNVFLRLIPLHRLPAAMMDAYTQLSGNTAKSNLAKIAGYEGLNPVQQSHALWKEVNEHDLLGKFGLGASELERKSPTATSLEKATNAFSQTLPRRLPEFDEKALDMTQEEFDQAYAAMAKGNAIQRFGKTALPEGWKVPIKRGEGAARTAMSALSSPLRVAYHVGHQTADFVESLNRLAPYIELRKQGYSPAEAARQVKKAQIDYGALTATERNVLKRAIPFYTFSAKILPPVVEELLEHPGGAMAHTMRTVNRAQNPEVATPEYVTETTGLPWELSMFQPKGEDGTRRYVTGLGLMHEEPVGMLGMAHRPRQLALEATSRLTPLARVPLELMFGQVTHQRDAMGGRQIEDLDPNLARTLQNVIDTKRGTYTPDIEAPLGINKPAWQNFEVMSQLLPINRFITTARQAFDPRKQGTIKALNLGTGLRVTDVSPRAEDAILQERIRSLQRQLGAKELPLVYFPEGAIEKLPEKKREVAEDIQDLNKLINKRQKDRKSRAAATALEL